MNRGTRQQELTALVELAAEGDLGQVLAVEGEGGEIGGRGPFITSAIAEGRCLVARDDGAIVGFAIHDRSLFGQPFLALLRVRTVDRRRGIGTALVQGVMAATEGDRLFSSTNASNVAMRMLLGRLGFVASGFIENLDPDDPEMIYIRWLGTAGPAPIPAPVEAPD